MSGPITGSKIDLIESSGADLPPPGTTRIIRAGGVTQQSVDGAAFAPVGGGGGGGSSSLSTALTRAQLIKASLTVPLYYEDFAYNPGNNQAGGTIAFGPNLAGTGSLDAVDHAGERRHPERYWGHGEQLGGGRRRGQRDHGSHCRPGQQPVLRALPRSIAGRARLGVAAHPDYVAHGRLRLRTSRSR